MYINTLKFIQIYHYFICISLKPTPLTLFLKRYTKFCFLILFIWERLQTSDMKDCIYKYEQKSLETDRFTTQKELDM